MRSQAYELSTLTGTQVLLLVVSESGWVYTFTTDKFKPLVKEDEHGQLSQGQKLIAACLVLRPRLPNDGPNLTTKESQENKEAISPRIYQGPYPTSPTHAPSTNPNFEANSTIHGGQIALKTNTRVNRPVATNRRVSSKGRNHIPTAIRTDGPPMPPPVPQLPTPLSGGYLDPQQRSPMRGQGMQQQQAEYGEMLHRAEMMQMQGGHPHYEGGPPHGYDNGMMYHSVCALENLSKSVSELTRSSFSAAK
jgi:hypothetical protein